MRQRVLSIGGMSDEDHAKMINDMNLLKHHYEVNNHGDVLRAMMKELLSKYGK